MPSERKLDVAAIRSLVVAGWTGRNVAALEAHIKELEAIGVKRPKTVPIFYRVARSLLTSDGTIEVMADKSSGEVEFVLYQFDDGLWLGVGSDHTDRKAETIGVTLSKQMCAKPVGLTLWRYEMASKLASGRVRSLKRKLGGDDAVAPRGRTAAPSLPAS